MSNNCPTFLKVKFFSQLLVVELEKSIPFIRFSLIDSGTNVNLKACGRICNAILSFFIGLEAVCQADFFKLKKIKDVGHLSLS